MNAVHVAAAGLLAFAAYQLYQLETQPGESVAGELLDDAENLVTDGIDMVKGLIGKWRAPEKYAPLIAAAEARHGIPAGLLERLLYQESRYREDIITGRTRSPAGALGIAQFMPATAKELGIDPLDPAQAIPAAGLYLRRMFNMFGDWKLALAAYNWGPGNVQRKGLDAAPLETRLYYSQILSSVEIA